MRKRAIGSGKSERERRQTLFIVELCKSNEVAAANDAAVCAAGCALASCNYTR